MKLPVTQALYAYWIAQRGERRLPDRHDLDPAAMRGVLPHTFMLEMAAPHYPVRLSGTRLDALFGRDMKDESFLDLWADKDKAGVRALIDGVLESACPAAAGLSGAPEGYRRESLEWLLLPLRHHGRTHARLLCSLMLPSTPTWLGLRPIEALTLGSWRFVDTAHEAPIERTAASGSRHQHLVVFQGGRPADAVTTHAQSRVKADVSRSARMFLSTRSP